MIIETGIVINDTYRIEKSLGKGSMGNIYLVERIRDGKKILVEEILSPLKDGQASNERSYVLFKEIFSARGKSDSNYIKNYPFFKKNCGVSLSEIKFDNKQKTVGAIKGGDSLVIPIIVISLLLISLCILLLGFSLPGFMSFLYY